MSIDYGLVGVAGAVLALLYAIVLFGFVRRQDAGTPKMKEIASAVRQGADAFLSREYRVIAPFAVVIVILIYVFIDIPLGTNGATAIGFAIGAALSAIAGYIGMAVTVRTQLKDCPGCEEGARQRSKPGFPRGRSNGNGRRRLWSARGFNFLSGV